MAITQTNTAPENNPTLFQVASIATLENCVKQILCGLSAATRNALAALIKTYIAQLEAAEAVLRAKLIYLDILTAPAKIANSLAQTVLTQIKAGANLIPLNLIGQCVGAGNINIAIQQNIDLALADINIITNDLARLLSFRDEVQAEIDEINATLNLFQQVVAAINVCP